MLIAVALFVNLGLAYILKLLDQYTQFDALHWFQSVRKKYEIDIRSQQGGASESKSRRNTSVAEEEKLQQTKALALKRIQIYQRVSNILRHAGQKFISLAALLLSTFTCRRLIVLLFNFFSVRSNLQTIKIS